MYIYTHTLNQIKSKKLVRTSFSTRKKKALFYIKQKHHKLRLECTLTRSADTKLAWVVEVVELQENRAPRGPLIPLLGRSKYKVCLQEGVLYRHYHSCLLCLQ